MRVETTPSLAARVWLLGETAVSGLNRLQPLALFAARCYVAMIFFRSGISKLRDWDSTLALFMDEYHVPLLNPTAAAFLGTGAELVLPVLLVLGLFGRVAAVGLSILNVVAAISLMDLPDPALMGHVFWGSLLLALVLWGPGPLSVDGRLVPWLRSRWVGGLVGSTGSTGAATST